MKICKIHSTLINMAAISRSFRVFHKLEPPYSVMLENRNIDDTLMFESNAVTVLCKLVMMIYLLLAV